jgi:endonuclease G, mitochondrial
VASSLLIGARMLRIINLALLFSISMSFGSTVRASEETEPNVVGGTRVPVGKWRDVVLVVGKTSTCTGTLVAADVVLTAAHCVVDEPYEIRSDTVDYAKPGGDRIPIKWSRAYPDWENKYDIGVIMLDHIARGQPRKIAAACTTREQLVAGAKVHLVGFGTTTAAGDLENTEMREANLVVTDPSCSMDVSCHRAVAPRGEFTAGGQGVDSCFGDSGGPVYLDTPDGPALVGVVSRGLSIPGVPCGNGGIYTRADKVVSWLKSVTGARIDRTADCGLDGPADGDSEDPVSGGCSTGGGSGIAGLGLGWFWLRRRRVSRCRHVST